MLLFLVFLAATVLPAQDSITQIPPANPPNRKVIVSDLHLGAGLDPKTRRWQPLEDFRFAPTFHRFLDYISASGSTDLIIAGDFIDFWQVLFEVDESRAPDLGSTEQLSLAKLDVVIKAHADTIGRLRKFGLRGNNRLIIIPGNHDVDLAWSKVQARLAGALKLPLNRKLFFTTAAYRSDGVHVEHGHQHDAPNRFRNPASPFTMNNGERRLETNFGSTFMSRFYNRLEQQRPFIDNVYPEMSALWFALKSESPAYFSYPQLQRGFTMLLRDQKTLRALRVVGGGFLGDEDNLQPVPEQNITNLIALFKQADSQVGKHLETIIGDPQMRAGIEADLHEVPQEVWRRTVIGIAKPPSNLGYMADIDDLLTAAQRIVVNDPGVAAVVMGHTHELNRTQVTRLVNVPPGDHWYVNTGCWQRELAVEDMQARNIGWMELNLDDETQFPRRFSYVVIDMPAGKPSKPERLFWDEPAAK